MHGTEPSIEGNEAIPTCRHVVDRIVSMMRWFLDESKSTWLVPVRVSASRDLTHQSLFTSPILPFWIGVQWSECLHSIGLILPVFAVRSLEVIL